MADYLNVNDLALTSIHLDVPATGVWVAECCLAEDSETVKGAATVEIDGVELHGTVIEGGTFGHQQRLTIVGGQAGWRNELPSKSYHNDAGVKATRVLNDLARDASEELGGVKPKTDRLGVDYARREGAGAITLNRVGGPWHVDFNGVTQVGPRAAVAVDLSVVDLLDHNPQTRIAEVSADDIRQVPVGGIITIEDAEYVICALSLDATDSGTHIKLWVNPSENPAQPVDRLSAAIRAIASEKQELLGAYGYLVTGMAAQRVNLKPLRKASGLPSLTAVSMWSAPGVSAQLKTGAKVAVMFLDGDPGSPIVTAFTPPDQESHEVDGLDLGGPGGAPLARVGDTVNVPFPPTLAFSGTIAGSPVVGVITPMIAATGVIQGGSPKVRAV